jgi:hypothetical protein
MSGISDKENEETKVIGEYAQSNKDFADEIKNFEDKPIPLKRSKRTFDEVSSGEQSTGSYCNKLGNTSKRFDIKKFKLIKSEKQSIDLSTEEGKYQKKQEELAAKRKSCTEICFNNYSDVREFQENFKVNKIS